MSQNDYIYAVARIRSKELSLLSGQFISQLMAAKSYDDCLKLLAERGWGNGVKSADEMLELERERTWKLIGDLVDDMSAFNVFLYANDYHNLKAAIKNAVAQTKQEGIYITQGTTVDYRLIESAVEKKDFGLLPEGMRKAGAQAMKTLLHTGDGQLCDLIVDKAALTAILAAGKASGNSILSLYAELMAVSSDIKIAVRAAKTGKDVNFLKMAVAECTTIDADSLINAAAQGIDEIYAYLENTSYSGAVKELKISPSAFERWCDNTLMEKIRPELYHAFTIGPLAAYILARENEIKTVRIILSGKLNSLPEDAVAERVREMYV
jgi:V/A-type H+/Na+-transporting ATPase subunit C